jgi:hypothetical protein
MSKGLIIRKRGIQKNALDAAPDEAYVSTQYPILKVHKRGHGKVQFAAAETNTFKQVKIKTELPYLPLVQVYAERAPGTNLSLVESTNAKISTDILIVVLWVEGDSLFITFQSDATNPAGDYAYTYYIFSDEAEE